MAWLCTRVELCVGAMCGYRGCVLCTFLGGIMKGPLVPLVLSPQPGPGDRGDSHWHVPPESRGLSHCP